MASGDLSLTSTSSQEEVESHKYVAYDRNLRPSSDSSGVTGATNVANNNNAAGSSSNASISAKKLDILKSQYDTALMELTKLRHQHSDTVRRCDDLSSQLAFYQDQYMAAVNQIKSTDHNKFTDIASENTHLKQQNALLERKLMHLIESVNKTEKDHRDSAQTKNNAYYCDYGEVSSRKCEGSCTESEKLMEELHLYKERNTDLIKEHNLIMAEREKYKKSFSSAVMELESLKKERNFYRDSREQFNLQREEMEKEIEKLKAVIAAESNKVLMITIQRSRIEEELNQLLSEKDNVLQEHQKMSDDLLAANKQIEQLKKDELIFKNEIKALQQSNSEFKRRDLIKSRESSWSKELSDNKEDSKEMEKLRKSLEKAHAELQRALQDMEESKRVRDWAISQREKIVQERDSVKTLCDNLRKERDKAISDLLSAIRDSEKIKKQKDEAQKNIDLLREQIENQNLYAASRRSFRMSAYEADDLLDVELCNYRTDSDLGIILDDTNNRQLVCGVTSISPAFGKLKINDVICKVNNLECQNVSKRTVLDQIRTLAPRCNLLVCRTRHNKRHFYTVHLNLLENRHHGLSLDTGIFISKIEQNSLASFQPELDVGDRVLSINNKSVEGMKSSTDIMNLLNDDRNESITIFGLKNIQDGYTNDVQRRMTNSSAQTDSMDSMHRATNSKHPSKIAEMLSKFKEKIHISKSGADTDSFEQENDALAALDSVLSENSSEKSKENLFKRSKRNKKEKEAAAKSMGTWPRTNILNATHENSTATIAHRERKRAPLSLFTAGPINVDKDDDTEVSDEPPPLPPQAKQQINLRSGSNLAKINPDRNSNPISSTVLYQNANINNANNGNFSYTRHSVYGGPTTLEKEHIMEQSKPLQRPSPLTVANMRVKIPNDKTSSQRNYQNRYSLNITPTEFYKSSGQQAQQQVINSGGGSGVLSRKQHLFDTFNNSLPSQNTGKTSQHPAFFMPLFSNSTTAFPRSNSAIQQNSLDMISIKSQNSIDSILSAKSPPISEYAVSNYPKRGGPMPQVPAPISFRGVSKYPSDSDSIASGVVGNSHSASGGGVGVAFYTNNIQQNRHTQLFPTFTQSSAHSHSHPMRHIRHSSPLTLPTPAALQTHPHTYGVNSPHSNVDANCSSGAIPASSVDKYEMDYVSAVHNNHPHAFLHDYPMPSHQQQLQQQQQHQSHYHSHVGRNIGGVMYENGTFPRKKDHQRLRIPSNPSVVSKASTVSGVKNSSGSIDHHLSNSVCNVPSSILPALLIPHSALVNTGTNGGGSGRGSPMPQVHVEVLSHGGSKRNSNVPMDFLCPGDLRRVTIEKSDKSLGITIQCNNNGGGIFVSTVAEKSIATRAGLQVGDQLLEVCGLNMRSATNDIAANVLRQCGNSITMLVQYNPEKFHSAEYDGTNNLEPEPSLNHSGSTTPRNSPRPPVHGMLTALPPVQMSSPPVNSVSHQNIMPPSSSLNSAQSIKNGSYADSLDNQSHMSSSQELSALSNPSTNSTGYEEKARYINLHMDKSKNLGIKLFGGNKVGIYVHDIQPGSPSDRAGIRKGDQILEYNGVDLRHVTAEQAANEISKLTDTVTMLVQNKLKKLKQIKDKSGDSFYIRAGFDRIGDLNEGDLRFVKDEVLYVDNTVFGGTFGLWRAWKLDAKGHRKECGIIPSQMKVEEELRSGEAVECEGGSTRRGSISARRSFFRRKKNQRSSSRDSTEIASFSNTQLSFFPDSGMLNEDGGILSYQRVERLDSPVRRPVLIIGPLSECVMDRLTIDFSNLFKLCEVTTMDCSQEAMEEGLQENIFVDYRRRGNKFECTTVESINNSCNNDRRHCILDMSISAVEHLQRLHIYPIVLLLRFKSAKQIREIRDFGTEKISAKAAKEMYERALKLENDYKQYISAVIPGVSIKHMCTQIKDAVDKEQDKLLWVPASCG